jgi:hypothetical protein
MAIKYHYLTQFAIFKELIFMREINLIAKNTVTAGYFVEIKHYNWETLKQLTVRPVTY